ncbi:MAG TPA: hypothetical protein VJT74_03400 [Pyrinomonadaceae bacterium]|nr:hypothetical protein [Pyrinomonadaceae bacterium]
MMKVKLTGFAVAAAVLFSCGSVAWSRQVPSSVAGTWRGESICMDKSRTACKNEEVVYRFEEVAGKQGVLTLLADKIIEGRRVPMGKLECKYDEAAGAISCEFTIRRTHGLWEYKVSGETMEGTLVLLPEKTLGRRVHVKRVADDEVPAPPDRKEYEGD